MNSDFIYIFNDSVHVCSLTQGADNPLGTQFGCQQKGLITMNLLLQVSNKSLRSDFIHIFYHYYRNDPKFSDRYVGANSVDPQQTAPRGAL